MNVSPARDRALVAFAALACLPAAAAPIMNPDLFWHLSAARRMADLGRLPAEDWLSHTMAGARWTDFEWLAQLLYYRVHGLAGMAGLLALKAALVAACAAVAWRTLRLYALPAPWAAAGLAAWGAGMMPRADLRPELFSLVCFAWLFKALETRRLGGGSPRPAWIGVMFCLWANLHAGFAYGLFLLACYAAAETLESRKPSGLLPALGASALGTAFHPAFPAHYGVLAVHWRDMGTLARNITEWGPVGFDPWRWPHWIFLFGGLGAAGACLLLGRGVPCGPTAALLWLGWSATAHRRLGAYHGAMAAPFALHLADRARLLPSSASGSWRRACWSATAAFAALALWCGSEAGVFRRVFQDQYYPARSAAFLERQTAALGGRPLYNDWQAGGFLGWRLHPGYRVFQDGRYLFHALLEEEARATRDPSAWSALMDRYGVEAALMPRLKLRVPTTRRYPGGGERLFERPYYAVFMPKEAWALVFWEENTLVFARRAAMPAAWLAEHEYRWLRPGDEEALADAVARGEVPEGALEAERARREAEWSAFAGTGIEPEAR